MNNNDDKKNANNDIYRCIYYIYNYAYEDGKTISDIDTLPHTHTHTRAHTAAVSVGKGLWRPFLRGRKLPSRCGSKKRGGGCRDERRL